MCAGGLKVAYVKRPSNAIIHHQDDEIWDRYFSRSVLQNKDNPLVFDVRNHPQCRKWLEDSGLDYDLGEVSSFFMTFTVTFKNAADATLFKLTFV